MLYTSKLLALGGALTLTISGANAQAADVVIGVPDWPSVRATAHVLKVALQEQLGVEVELQNGANPEVFAGMDAGSIHVHPEMWLPNQKELKAQYIDERQSVKLSPNSVAGEQGMCVTRSTAERTGIKKLEDLQDPQMAEKFDTDGDGIGNVWIGSPEWASTAIEKVRARSYGYDQTMTLEEMPESMAMARVDSAVMRNRNIVFFCYTPHYVFSLHDLVMLEEPEHDESKWSIVLPTTVPGWLEKSEAGVAWESSSIHIAYAADLEVEHPEVAAMLSRVSLDADTVSDWTRALEIEGQTPTQLATEWVEANSETVAGWFD